MRMQAEDGRESGTVTMMMMMENGRIPMTS